MPTASFVKYENFAEDLANKVHDLFGTNDTLKVLLTNSAPNAATHKLRSEAGELSTSGGYTSGGEDTQNDGTRSGGVVSVTGVDITWTGSGSGFTFRYAVLWNDTPSSPLDPLIGYWDYGSSILVGAGETFQLDIGSSMFTIT